MFEHQGTKFKILAYNIQIINIQLYKKKMITNNHATTPVS